MFLFVIKDVYNLSPQTASSPPSQAPGPLWSRHGPGGGQGPRPLQHGHCRPDQALLQAGSLPRTVHPGPS